jgi:3',5'-cyclic AMP phosphodiesterase CpdA
MNRRNFIHVMLGTVVAGTMLGALPGRAEENAATPPRTNRNASVLHFSPGGKFKIVQFTDTHLGQDHDPDGSRKRKLFEEMSAILDAEKPDLVALTGDIVTFADRRDPRPCWKEITAPMATRRIPWFAVMGNHDDEYNRTVGRSKIMAFLESLPYSLSKPGPAELGGGGNFVLSVRGTNGTAALLYGIDSRSYPNNAPNGEYDWIHFDQIAWYRKESAAFTAANGGKPLPSLAFFHIPLPEYAEGTTSATGQAREAVCSAKINSGMLCAMAECGDVMGVFVGHDHDNDYGFTFSRKTFCQKGIFLAYGRKTGSTFAYHHLPSGARVIELTEGRRAFDTWIRNADGSIEFKTSFPGGK